MIFREWICNSFGCNGCGCGVSGALCLQRERKGTFVWKGKVERL